MRGVRGRVGPSSEPHPGPLVPTDVVLLDCACAGACQPSAHSDRRSWLLGLRERAHGAPRLPPCRPQHLVELYWCLDLKGVHDTLRPSSGLFSTRWIKNITSGSSASSGGHGGCSDINVLPLRPI